MAMHSNWNPWHGCLKCSEGCQNCYVYYLDRMRGKSGADVYKTKTGFRYPLSKDRSGQYKIQSGEMISVCMTSDFFLEEADEWRREAWKMMHIRSDVISINELTKGQADAHTMAEISRLSSLILEEL